MNESEPTDLSGRAEYSPGGVMRNGPLEREVGELEGPCQPLGPGVLCEPGRFTAAHTSTTGKFRK